MSLLWWNDALLSCWDTSQTLVHVQAGGDDGLASAVAGDAGVGAAVILPNIHQDQAVLETRAGELVSRRVSFNPQNILREFFLQPVHAGSRRACGDLKKKPFIFIQEHLHEDYTILLRRKSL